MTDREAIDKFQPTAQEVVIKHPDRQAADGGPLYGKETKLRLEAMLQAGFVVVQKPVDPPKEAKKITKEVDATDTARDLAKEHGIDLGGIKGSGKDGRIVTGDVQKLVDNAE